MDTNWGVTVDGAIHSDETLDIFNQVADAHNRKVWQAATVKRELEKFFEELSENDNDSDCPPMVRKILINARYAQKIKMQKALENFSSLEDKLEFIHGVRKDFSRFMNPRLSAINRLDEWSAFVQNVLTRSELKVMDVVSLYPSDVKHSLKGLKLDPPKVFDDGPETQIVSKGSPSAHPGMPIHFNSIAEVMETTGLKEETIRDLWNSGYFYREVKFTTNGWHRDPVRP